MGEAGDLNVLGVRYARLAAASLRGGSPPECDSEVELRIALFVHHLPQLIKLIESERSTDRVIGGVYLEMLDDGAMIARWIAKNGEVRERIRRFPAPAP